MSFVCDSKGRRWILNPENATVGTIQNISFALNQKINMAVFSVCMFLCKLAYLWVGWAKSLYLGEIVMVFFCVCFVL